jgi:hypothetical protein
MQVSKQDVATTAVPKRKAASPSAPAMAPLAAPPRASAAQGGSGESSPDAKDVGRPEGGGRGNKSIKIVSYDHESDSDFI